MDEYLASKNGDPSKNIQEMLRSTLESEEWRALTPNFPSPGHDLLPQELNEGQLGLIVDAVKDLPLPSESEPETMRRPVDLGEAGMLTFIGHGESKLCFELEKDGKKMAVIIQGYQSKLGVQVPKDPYLTKINETLNGAVWEYSSLRTYAMLPLPNNKAIRLQEFGEPASKGLGSVAGSLRGALSRRTITNYIAEHVPGATLGQGTNTDLELRQSRHLLTKPGHNKPVFIDIPVVQRTGGLPSY